MSDAIIKLDHLRKRFGRKTVLDDVTLRVPQGRTFALLGRNGAGKTTTIRMLIGLLKPDAGKAEIFGLDCARQAIALRRRIGYLAEDQRLFGWMRIEQIIDFMAPFYPTWDHDHARRLLQRFELPRRTRVKHLSKGQGVRLGLLLALAHRPRLMILDDPALGLDPIMRKEFNRDVITLLQHDGATVFYSSHLLYEVEPVADQVAILDRGRIVLCEETENLRQRFKQIVVAEEDDARLRQVSPRTRRLDVTRSGHEVAIIVENPGEFTRELHEQQISHRVIELNLDEIFQAIVIGQPDPMGNEADLPATTAAKEVHA